MKVFQIVSRHGYDTAARNPRLTHYKDAVSETVLCGRTIRSFNWIVPARDQTQIATCKRCLERAAKRVMLNKEKSDPTLEDVLADILG